MAFKGGPSYGTGYVPSAEGLGSNIVQMLPSLERMIMYNNSVRRHTFAFLQDMGDHFFLMDRVTRDWFKRKQCKIIVWEDIPLYSFKSRGKLLFSSSSSFFFHKDAYASLEEVYAAYHMVKASLRRRYHRGMPMWRTALSRLCTLLERWVCIFGRLFMQKSFLTSHFCASWTFLLSYLQSSENTSSSSLFSLNHVLCFPISWL